MSTLTWIKKEEKGVVYRPASRINVIGAYIMKGKYAFMLKKGSTSSDHILYYFKLIDQLLSDWFGSEYKSSTVFVLDNAAVHVSDYAKKYYERMDFSVLTLPPYTPEYNKIEKVFAQLKHRLTLKILHNKHLEYIVAQTIRELKK